MNEIKLSQHELEIIECMVLGWTESENMGLYGNISYQCVVDLCNKLNIRVPDKLTYICSCS